MLLGKSTILLEYKKNNLELDKFSFQMELVVPVKLYISGVN